LSRPIREFTEALRRFGTAPRAWPIPEAGPRELRSSIGAFNALQAQIQKFVDDRTAMLAAISHDLRTPLTKMRLRGEFVEDDEQRARLFPDVDDMQAMVDLALAYFRDDFQGEETTTFDFPEMLRTIADDYTDQGSEISAIPLNAEHALHSAPCRIPPGTRKASPRGCPSCAAAPC
jgi:signal transduction histidine kinase